MISLPDVTLVAMGSTDIDGMVNALEYSCRGIDFGQVKLISHVCPRFKRGSKVTFEYTNRINSIDEWNEAIIFNLPSYITTSHALLVHPDGYVIHPELWKDVWLNLDFIGSPWPLPRDNYSYRDEEGNIVRVGNSVGLRSKRLMDLVATRPMTYHYGNNNEDGHITCWNRKWLESQGCKFATFQQALDFGKEAPLPENEGRETFLFHKFE